MIRIDRLSERIAVNPIFGWRQDAFVRAYAEKAPNLPGRTPVERAVLGFVEPHLLPSEREFVAKNSFQLRYLELDWELNDLTGGARR
jgi:hypothetical protein